MEPVQLASGMCYEGWQRVKKEQEKRASQNLLLFVMLNDNEEAEDEEEKTFKANCRKLCKVFMDYHKHTEVVLDYDAYRMGNTHVETMTLNLFLKRLETTCEEPWVAFAKHAHKWAVVHEAQLREMMHEQFEDIFRITEEVGSELSERIAESEGGGGGGGVGPTGHSSRRQVGRAAAMQQALKAQVEAAEQEERLRKVKLDKEDLERRTKQRKEKLEREREALMRNKLEKMQLETQERTVRAVAQARLVASSSSSSTSSPLLPSSPHAAAGAREKPPPAESSQQGAPGAREAGRSPEHAEDTGRPARQRQPLPERNFLKTKLSSGAQDNAGEHRDSSGPVDPRHGWGYGLGGPSGREFEYMGHGDNEAHGGRKEDSSHWRAGVAKKTEHDTEGFYSLGGSDIEKTHVNHSSLLHPPNKKLPQLSHEYDPMFGSDSDDKDSDDRRYRRWTNRPKDKVGSDSDYDSNWQPEAMEPVKHHSLKKHKSQQKEKVNGKRMPKRLPRISDSEKPKAPIVKTIKKAKASKHRSVQDLDVVSSDHEERLTDKEEHLPNFRCGVYRDDSRRNTLSDDFGIDMLESMRANPDFNLRRGSLDSNQPQRGTLSIQKKRMSRYGDIGPLRSSVADMSPLSVVRNQSSTSDRSPRTEKLALEMKVVALIENLMPAVVNKLAGLSQSQDSNKQNSSFGVQKISSRHLIAFVHEALFGDTTDERKALHLSGEAVDPTLFLAALKENTGAIGLYHDLHLAHKVVQGDEPMLQQVLQIVHQELQRQMAKYMKQVMLRIESERSNTTSLLQHKTNNAVVLDPVPTKLPDPKFAVVEMGFGKTLTQRQTLERPGLNRALPKRNATYHDSTHQLATSNSSPTQAWGSRRSAHHRLRLPP